MVQQGDVLTQTGRPPQTATGILAVFQGVLWAMRRRRFCGKHPLRCYWGKDGSRLRQIPPGHSLGEGRQTPIFLEFTHTSRPSKSKLAYCGANGIDLLELDGSQRPVHSAVLRAQISPSNCRQSQRQRLIDLWQHMASLDDPLVGIKEDFRSPERQRRERDAFLAEFEERRQEVADGKLRCARCNKPFASQDGGFSLSFIYTHRPDGGCGEVPFCDECSFTVGGGWHGEYSDDANSWGLDEECPACRPIIAESAKQSDKSNQRRSLLMPRPYGSRLIEEPGRRQQQYIVGNRTVSRSELQSVLIMVAYVLGIAPPARPVVRMMLNQVQSIQKAIQHANNISNLDWLEGIGESYVTDADIPDDGKGDNFLCIKRWWAELPPCPLVFI